MFDSVLIANRGEIACRIIRTARRLGLRTIAIYHHQDRRAPHVELADEAHIIEADVPTAAYLDIGQIINIAGNASASCVHPGYGFLSENAEFAAAVEATKMTFIGPQPEIIRLMGDKNQSREFAQQTNVPTAPSARQKGDLDALLADATRLGFPLLIKAVAGGGGKGMSIVHNEADLVDCARTASSEAARYFADGRIYAERYIERGRHIEVQILGDGKGDAIHLFERECSVQRRFQKIIEESPATSLDHELRCRICETAVNMAKNANYRNAGTVEFIVAPDGEFYFLETNTRLQVEHPVTELVCGVDLVEAQFRIAATGELPWHQEDIRQSGHAIECRIYCEESDGTFLPAVGTVKVLNIPDVPGIRFDGGIALNQTITAAFDPMAGKLICHGTNRNAAINLCERGLNEIVLLGVNNNIDYLRGILKHEAFKAGRLHTEFIKEHTSTLIPDGPNDSEQTALLIAAALDVDNIRTLIFDTPEPYASIGDWQN